MPAVSWKPVAGSARLVRAVLGGCLAFSVAPIHAQETSLQASFAGRSYVLVRADEGYCAVLEDGREPVVARERARRGVRRSGRARVRLAGRGSSPGRGRRRAGAGAAARERRRESRSCRCRRPGDGDGGVSPQPLVESGELIGLVWLEGSDPSALGVRAAAWNGTGFSAAEWVAPPIDGSQLALSGAVLARRELAPGVERVRRTATTRSCGAVATARPGRRRRASTRATGCPTSRRWWRRPRAARSRRGAATTAASYRGRVMRFEPTAGGGTKSASAGRARCSRSSSRTTRPSRPQLVLREGVEGRWDLIELGGAGEVRSRTQWSGDPDRRPVVRRGAGGAARLEWIGAAAANGRARREPTLDAAPARRRLPSPAVRRRRRRAAVAHDLRGVRRQHHRRRRRRGGRRLPASARSAADRARPQRRRAQSRRVRRDHGRRLDAHRFGAGPGRRRVAADGGHQRHSAQRLARDHRVQPRPRWPTAPSARAWWWGSPP